MLDVATPFTRAARLYEACGWIRAGQVRLRLPDGRDVEELVYVAPRCAATGASTGRHLAVDM